MHSKNATRTEKRSKRNVPKTVNVIMTLVGRQSTTKYFDSTTIIIKQLEKVPVHAGEVFGLTKEVNMTLVSKNVNLFAELVTFMDIVVTLTNCKLHTKLWKQLQGFTI